MAVLNVEVASRVGDSTRLNEDAVGYCSTGECVIAWVIDGATALAPATNAIVHRFGAVLSTLIGLRASSNLSLAGLAEAALRGIADFAPDLHGDIMALPRYARPLASLVIIKVNLSQPGLVLDYCVMGDCAILLTGEAPAMIVQQSRASRHLVQLLHESQIVGNNQNVVRYQRNRRRRQQGKDYCRWATLDAIGCPRATTGQSRLAEDGAVLLCSDGAYEPLLDSGWKLRDILKFGRSKGVLALIDQAQDLSAHSHAIRPKAVDDASAMLIHRR